MLMRYMRAIETASHVQLLILFGFGIACQSLQRINREWRPGRPMMSRQQSDSITGAIVNAGVNLHHGWWQ
jgi:hypothetical protein